MSTTEERLDRIKSTIKTEVMTRMFYEGASTEAARHHADMTVRHIEDDLQSLLSLHTQRAREDVQFELLDYQVRLGEKNAEYNAPHRPKDKFDDGEWHWLQVGAQVTNDWYSMKQKRDAQLSTKDSTNKEEL